MSTPTNCPHCGAGPAKEWGWVCGRAGGYDESGCYERQIAALKAELEKAKAERAQMVRRDDPRLVNIGAELAVALSHCGDPNWESGLSFARHQLQSIIEGK